ncbi:MAG: GAF domain-containing protein [Comamonadaceae bacterium]|nr:MAG: GAF domain-containing protein [Comamonadaceae bacterium]
MRAASIPPNEPERLAALRQAHCAYAPREERFDRITRTLRRLLNVPIALLTIVEENEQWFRSVQGLHTDHTPRDISFCGHVVATGKTLIINDTHTDPDFLDNPLVTGSPGIRSYVGWPLEIAPGLVAGSLCAIDTMPRVYSADELAGLRDLAGIAESELRSQAAAGVQKALWMRLDLMQRRHSLDPVTGCWSIRGFRELLGLGVAQARSDHGQLALCHLSIRNFAPALAGLNEGRQHSLLSVVAQLLRERLPADGALARLGDLDFCAMVSAPAVEGLNQLLAPLTQTELVGVLPGGQEVDMQLDAYVVRLSDLGHVASAAAAASRLWAAVLAAPVAARLAPAT